MLPFLISRLLLAAAPACGGPIDLDTALGLAATRSDEVTIKQAELASAQVDTQLARAARIAPSFTATVITGPSPEARGSLTNPSSEDVDRDLWTTLEQIRPFVRTDVQLIQPLYTWGRLDAARDAANAGVRARESLVRDTVGQVQLRVQQLYWGVSLARKLIAIADDVTHAAEDASRRIKQAIEDGSSEVSPSDQYKVEVFKGTIAGRTAEAKKGLELAQLGLAATLGLDPAKLVLKETPLDVTPGEEPDAAKALADAATQRPDLHALDNAIQARSSEVASERGAMLPQFFLMAQAEWAWAPNRDDPKNPWVSDPFSTHGGPVAGFILGFRQDLSFPMLSAKAKKAEAERATLERQRAGLARLVQVQVSTAVAEVKAARSRFMAASSSFRAARALYRSAGLDFAAGLIETNPLIDAYKEFVENQVSAAQAAYDLVVARARLAQVTGEAPKKGLTCERP